MKVGFDIIPELLFFELLFFASRRRSSNLKKETKREREKILSTKYDAKSFWLGI